MLAGIPWDGAGTQFRLSKGKELFLAGVTGEDTLFREGSVWLCAYQFYHDTCPQGIPVEI